MRHRMLRWRIQQASRNAPGMAFQKAATTPSVKPSVRSGDVYLVAINVTAFTGTALPR